jgi:inhibitor of KinA sporulation pathway (predicted exonuclease)
MDPRVGAWEPPGAEGSTSASVSQQSGSAGLSTDAQVSPPPPPPRQQSMDSGGQTMRGSAEFYPSGANGSAQQHRKWVDPAAATYYQESLAEDAATGAEMRGGLLVVESSAGPGDGADPPHYGGFQHTELYGARPNQPSYGSDAYQPHDFLSAHGAHEQHPRHLYSDEAAYDYAYGAMAFAHPQSFEHRQAGALDLYPPESSPSTASESLESPALVYSPGGTMYSLPGAGPASLSSPAAHSRTELQPPDVLQPRSHSAIFPPLSAPLLSSSPRLSVEIGAGLGSVEMPQQPVDYIGVVDFECTCDRIRSQARSGTGGLSCVSSPRWRVLVLTNSLAVCASRQSDDGPEPEWVHEIIEFPLVLVDAVTLEPVDEFHAYIRPTERPVLTNFCKTLTGISQDTVDAADTLEVALEQFATWLTERQLGAPGEPGSVFTIALATDGPWDIVNFLAPECERKGLPFPSCAKHWIDARAAFAEWHQIKQLNVQKMLEWSGMEFEGRPHSGIDDTRNIARIVTHLLSQGCAFRSVTPLHCSTSCNNNSSNSCK